MFQNLHQLQTSLALEACTGCQEKNVNIDGPAQRGYSNEDRE